MIGIIAHSLKQDARELVATLCTELDGRGIAYTMEQETAALVGRVSELDEYALAAGADLLVVLGGDGTILRVVHRIREHLKPIFGINIGSLGFLTCFGSGEGRLAVEAILAQDYNLSPRHLLRVELFGPGGDLRGEYFALNDVVLSRGEPSRLVRLRVEIDGEPLTDYNADGLIISTPTGSTAYALSAGGPILMPDSGVTVVTPICPHVLTNRAVVVGDQSIIEVRLAAQDQKVFVTVDGQACVPKGKQDVLRVTKSERCLPLAMHPERPFTEVLRQKLKWSGSSI